MKHPGPFDWSARLTPVALAFVVSGALMFGLGAVWAISTPLFAAPDEPAHAVRAVASWSGDPGGTVVHEGGVRVKSYRVPSPYDEAQAIAVCSAFHPDRTACGPAFDATGRTVTAMSNAGFYPPLFYRLVGWAGALLDGSRGMYAMRLINATACATLIGLAAASSMRRGSSALAAAGLAFAVTPMVAFLSGTVNNSGLEITAAIALWCSMLTLVRGRAGASTPMWSDMSIAVLSGLVLTFSRPISPLFTAVICGLVLIATPDTRIRMLLRRRDLVATVSILAVGSAAATLQIIRSGQFESPMTSGWLLGPGDTPLSFGLGTTEVLFRQMVAWFGWLDTGTAQLSFYGWTVACGSLVIGAVLLGVARRWAGIGLTVLAVVALPIAANWGQARTAGFVWQGRYTLPLAVGIPILAAITCDEARLDERVRRRAVGCLATIAAVGQVYAVYWALRRFSVGLHGELFFFGGSAWAPPVLGTIGTMVAATVTSIAMAGSLVAWSRRSRPADVDVEPVDTDDATSSPPPMVAAT